MSPVLVLGAQHRKGASEGKLWYTTKVKNLPAVRALGIIMSKVWPGVESADSRRYLTVIQRLLPHRHMECAKPVSSRQNGQYTTGDEENGCRSLGSVRDFLGWKRRIYFKYARS